jgi:hypothetical protein
LSAKVKGCNVIGGGTRRTRDQNARKTLNNYAGTTPNCEDRSGQIDAGRPQNRAIRGENNVKTVHSVRKLDVNPDSELSRGNLRRRRPRRVQRWPSSGTRACREWSISEWILEAHGSRCRVSCRDIRWQKERRCEYERQHQQY